MGPRGDAHHPDEPDPDEPDGPAASGAQRPPPDQLDRLWRHPSELGGATPRAVPGTGIAGAVRVTAPPRPGRFWFAAAGAVLGAAATLATVAAVGGFDDTVPGERGPAVAAGPAAPDAPAIAAAAAPGLVTVTVRDAGGARRLTGVCVQRDGVVTSARALGDAPGSVEVSTGDGTPVAVTVVGRDEATDVAYLRAERPLTAAALGHGTPEVGTAAWVVAPRPARADAWIAPGTILSTTTVLSAEGGPTYSGLLATDAEAGAGGGALVDRSGQVLGMVVGPGADPGVSYALPIGVAADVAAELRATGTAAHGWLGIEAADLEGGGGAVVRAVVPGQAAERAGIRAGDVVVAIDRQAVLDMRELIATVRARPPDQVVMVRVQRAGEEHTIEVRLSSTAGEGFRATMDGS